MNSTLLALLGSALLSLAQHPTQAPATRDDLPACSELQLAYFRPRYSSPEALVDVASEFIEPQFQARDGDGVRYVQRFMILGRTIVLQDEPDELADRVSTLEALDANAREETTEVAIQRGVYRPKNVNRDTLVAGISAIPGVEITALDNSRDLIVSCPESISGQVRDLLRELDAPVPRISLTCRLICGRDQDELDASGLPAADPRLPAGLVERLAEVLPMPGFELVSLNAMEATLSGRELGLASTITQFLEFEVRLQPAAYDPTAGRLTLSKCEFRLIEVPFGQPDLRFVHRLETSLVLVAGETTVLGALGSDPMFVALEFKVR